VKNYDRESDGVKGENLEVHQWRWVYIRRIQSLLDKWRHRTPLKHSRV